MRFLILSTVLVLSACKVADHASDHSNSVSTLYTVQGTLTQSSSYCGGVHPTWEEQMEYQKARPFYTWLYVRSGKTNKEDSPIIDSVQTDNNGRYSFKLPAGDYVIITPEQRTKEVLNRYKKMENKDLIVDDLCLSGWWKGGLFQVSVVDSAITGLDHNFHSRCFVPVAMPCMTYTGPYPP
jgi:hypothetical protein